MRKLLPLMLLPLLSACFAERKPFVASAPPADAAQVYFYRISQMTGLALKPVISANGKELGRLPNHSYAVALLPPGPVDIQSKWAGIPGTSRDDKLGLNLEAGKSYFVRVRYRTNKDKAAAGPLVFENRYGLEEVEAAEAAKQLAGMSAAGEFASAAK